MEKGRLQKEEVEQNPHRTLKVELIIPNILLILFLCHHIDVLEYDKRFEQFLLKGYRRQIFPDRFYG